MNERTIALLLPGYVTEVDDPSAEYLGAKITHACCELFEFTEGHEQLPWQASLFKVLHLPNNPQRLPSARLALTQLRADNIPHKKPLCDDLLRADPVFLKADRDSAKLVPATALGLETAEVDELLASINTFVKEDGLYFFRDNLDQWFVSGKSATDLESFPPSFLANRNTSAFMPEGPDSPYWRRLMTELQMLLHTHPVNQVREQRGLMPVNSVWFWGGGELPECQVSGGASGGAGAEADVEASVDVRVEANVGASGEDVTIFADEPEAVQLAAHLQLNCEPLSNLAQQIDSLPAAQSVIVDTRLMQAWVSGDGEQLAQSLAQLNEQWLAPLSAQVQAGRLQALTLLTEDGLQGICTRATSRVQDSGASGSWLQRIVSMFKINK